MMRMMRMMEEGMGRADRRMKGKEEGKTSSARKHGKDVPDKDGKQDGCVSVHRLGAGGCCCLCLREPPVYPQALTPKALGTAIPSLNGTSQRRSGQWRGTAHAPQGATGLHPTDKSGHVAAYQSITVSRESEQYRSPGQSTLPFVETWERQPPSKTCKEIETSCIGLDTSTIERFEKRTKNHGQQPSKGRRIPSTTDEEDGSMASGGFVGVKPQVGGVWHLYGSG